MDVLEYRLKDDKWRPVGVYRVTEAGVVFMFLEEWVGPAQVKLEGLSGKGQALAEHLVQSANWQTVIRTTLPESGKSLEDVFVERVGGKGVKGEL